EELSKYIGQGRYYEVIAFHKKELVECSQGKAEYGGSTSTCCFGNHMKLGDAYMEIGFYEEALEHYLLAMKYAKILQEDLNAQLEDLRAKYGSTLPKYISDKSSSALGNLIKLPQHELLKKISKIFLTLGNHDEALKYAREASSIKGSESMEQLNIETVNASKMLKGKRPDLVENLPGYLKSSVLAMKTMEYLDLADLYAMNGNNAEALKFCEEGLKAIDEAISLSKDGILMGNVLILSDIFLKKGTLQMRMKNYPAAELSFRETERVLDYHKKNVAENPELQKEERKWHTFKIKIEKHLPSSLASLALATGRYQDALTHLNNIDIQGNDVLSDRIVYHTQRGEVLSHLGQTKDAAMEYLKAALLVEEARGRLRKAQEGFMGAEDRVKSYRGIVSVLAERALKGDLSDPSFSAYGRDLKQSAFYFAESTKARTLLDVIAASGRKTHDVTIPKDLQEKEAMLAGELFAVEGEWSAAYTKGEAALTQLRQKKQQLTSELNTLIGHLRQDYPRYASLKYPSPVIAENIPLKTNEVLLEYALGDEATYLFVIRKGGAVKLIKITVRKEVLETKIKTFMEPLNAQQHAMFSPGLAGELYNLLLADALKEVKKTDKVIIVPDGILGLLPFETLVIQEGKDSRDSVYIGDRFTITYAQSATVLALNRMLNPTKATKPLFALGNPFYSKDDPRYIAFKQGTPQPVLLAQNLDQYAFRGLATRREWGQVLKDDKEGKPLIYTPLPETEGEVRQIAKLFNAQPNPPDILLGINANETTFKQTPLAGYRYLHFATHGDLPGKLQGINEPFLLLGQVENQGNDNGFLTLSKALGLKLDADMVLLSACMTGRGKVMEGEGVVNFARAFQHAGARSVVVSLWEVASQETVEYMTTFYRYLKEGKSRSEALLLTRSAMKKKYPNPFYWGPFVLYGEG
ncbi:MAG: CHAT domain-containing protein, partial [Proteobacteria bacterium]|nr:CHAT domain-containing protein [Pseudomonadota bacterium]